VITIIDTSCGPLEGIREDWIQFDKAYWDASITNCKGSVKNYLAELDLRYDDEYGKGTRGIANVYARVKSTVGNLRKDADKLFVRPNESPQ
jgi:hypothetical protein